MSRGAGALLTDLYQLTMANAYFELGMHDTAVFELYVRRLPPGRRFLVAAGLEHVVHYLEQLRFETEEIEYLRGLGLFSAAFLAHLAQFRFTGSLHAMREGTPFWCAEPVIRVTAPIMQAQLVESRVLNLVHFETLIASKAARCVLVARGRQLVDFGMRRAHGSEAALHAARATYLAGFDATATVEAGRLFGIPVSGTMAHSFIEAHDREEDAFRRFLLAAQNPTTLLIDTYDTERAALTVATLIHELESAGRRGAVRAVRIDSGDLCAQAHAVRGILDRNGLHEVQIILSGNLDELQVHALLEQGVPADAFGIGTHVDVSVDAPALDTAYKLQEYAGRARRKCSPGKQTWPGRKQVYRQYGAGGRIQGDCVALADETVPGEPLLAEVMRDGRLVAPLPALTASREYCRQRLAELPDQLREIGQSDFIEPVRISSAVQALAQRIDREREQNA